MTGNSVGRSIRPGHSLEAMVLGKIEGGEVEAEEFRQAFHELGYDGSDFHFVGQSLAHLHHGLLKTVAFGEEEAVDRSLESVAEGLEEQDNRQGEYNREIGRVGQASVLEDAVERRDAARIEGGHQGGRDRVEQALAKDDLDVEKLETNNGVSKGDGHQDQRHHAIEDEPLGVQERGESHGEKNERDHAEEGADENEACAPTLLDIGKIASAQAERAETEHHVADHDPPVGHGCAGDERHPGSRPPRSGEGRDIDQRWQEVDRNQMRADPGDPSDGVGDGIASPLPHRAREDQEEMEKCGGQKEQRHGAGGEHERIDPRIRRGSQTAHQKEHEKAAHDVEDACRRQSWLSDDDKGADAEEEESEEGGIEIGGVADPPAPEFDLAFLDAAARAEHIGHRLADGVTIEELLGVARRRQNGAIDPDDDIALPDAGEVGSRARNHFPDHRRARNINLEDDPVVGPLGEHIRHRKGGQQEGQNPRRQERGESAVGARHHQYHTLSRPNCS